MVLTNKQEQGLKITLERYKNKEKYTVISGYAGSGKTTLIRYIIEALNIDENKICYCAYTGKAAEVLRKKGNKNVKTLHKLLYDYYPKKTGGFVRKPKIDLGYKIIIVDEVSMAPKELVDLLLTHNVFCIFLGDPYQLPPINKQEDNHLLDNPHIFLDEIMRQAQESGIIRLTMDIRNQKTLDSTYGEEAKIIPYSEINTDILVQSDQILTATNKKRQAINQIIRNFYGRANEEPQDGDKVVCLRNYWDYLSEIEEDALVNGSIGILNNSFKSFISLPPDLQRRYNIKKFDTLIGDIVIPETNDVYKNINTDYNLFKTGTPCCDWKLSYDLGRKKLQDIIPKEFDFAYALTVHRAQGSEWDKVLVLEEKFPFDREEHSRWLYTACTRASSRLVLFR